MIAADIVARVHDGFARQPFMATLGATLGAVAPGCVEIHLPCRAALMQQTGVVHAGAVTALVDSACGFAALTGMPPGADVLSIEFKINLLAPAIGDALRATGRVVKQGRTITVCAGEVHAVTGATDTLVAVMQATMFTRLS